MDEEIERGLRTFAEMAGQERADGMRALGQADGFGAAYYRLAAAIPFGAVWARPGLSRRDRSLLTLGAAVEMRDPRPIREHIRMALGHGLQPRELEEALIQLVPYCGFPAVATAFEIAEEILAARGVATAKSDVA